VFIDCVALTLYFIAIAIAIAVIEYLSKESLEMDSKLNFFDFLCQNMAS
tara:strand:- start:275 stop:421 length:147 start_codon:yes stop_codon:yes gene_type:complete